MSDKFLEIQDPVVSSFYDKLESCYDKTDDYLKERVKSDELVEESNLMRENILDYITVVIVIREIRDEKYRCIRSYTT